MRAPGYFLLLAAALLGAAPAFAQSAAAPLPGFELDPLTPNADGEGSLLVGSGPLLPKGEVRVAMVGGYARNPLMLARLGTTVGALVRDRVTGSVTAAYAPVPWLEVALRASGVLLQDGADLRQEGVATPARAGLSTPSAGVRLGLLDQRYGAPVDLALGAEVGLPLGSAAALGRDPGVRVSPRVMAGGRFGALRVGGELGALLRPPVVLDPAATGIQDALGSALEGGVTVGPAYSGRRPRWEMDLVGTLPLDQRRAAMEVLGGVRYPVNLSAKAPPRFELFLLGGVGLGAAPGTPLFRVLAGVAFGNVLPVRHPTDPLPQCEEGLDYEPRDCPDLDWDHDGVKNRDDRCPREVGTKELLGCTNKDSDGDGTPDILDRCPGVPGLAARQGCPILDRDGDGVEDHLDACPDSYGPPENRGCPLKPSEIPKPDADKDGIPDEEDNCPKVEGPSDNEGCPLEERQLIRMTAEKLVYKITPQGAKAKVYFDPRDRARVDRASFILLEQVADVLRGHPELRLRIHVHTDNRADAASSLRLTQARAEAVRAYLISSGVPAERLEARGMGQAEPVDSNDSVDGRENNRRVEFLLSK